MDLNNYRIKPTTITKHRILRGLGKRNAVQYYTSWDEITVKTWEHETDFERYGSIVSRYWAGESVQIRGEHSKYRRYRVQLAKRMLACAKGERHVLVAKDYKVCCDVRRRPGIYSRDIIGSYIHYKTNRAGWQLARVVMVADDAPNKALPHTIKLLDLGNRYNVHLYEDKLKTFSEGIGIWCWHVNETAKSCKKIFHAEEQVQKGVRGMNIEVYGRTGYLFHKLIRIHPAIKSVNGLKFLKISPVVRPNQNKLRCVGIN